MRKLGSWITGIIWVELVQDTIISHIHIYNFGHKTCFLLNRMLKEKKFSNIT